MSKSVYILDDRKNRRDQGLAKTSFNGLNDGAVEIEENFDVNGNDVYKKLEKHSLIAIHRSWLINTEIYNKFLDEAKTQGKLLVIFSGGLSQSLFIDKNILTLNANSFYTDRLPEFIKRYINSEGIDEPLLYLLYGENWQLPLLTEYRQLLWRVNRDEYTDELVVLEQLEEKLKSIYPDFTPEGIDQLIETEKKHYLK